MRKPTAARGARAAVLLTAIGASCGRQRLTPPPDLPAVGGQVSLFRLPGAGGSVEIYHPDSLKPWGWASLQPVPPIRRVLGADLGERLLWALDTQNNLIGVDLETRTVRKREAGVVTGTVGPDGSLYLADTSRQIIRVARREAVRFHDPLPAPARALFAAMNDQVVAITAAPPFRIITANSDQVVQSAPLPAGEVSATVWGDLVALATDTAVVLYETGGPRSQRALPRLRHVRRVGFSPSGHRLLVSQQQEARIRVFDRFTLGELETIRLPGLPREFRVDPSGRWLLVHRAAGDSVWVVDLATNRLVTTVLGEWGADLPTVAGASSLLVRQGDDVVALDLRQAPAREVARLPEGGRDLWLAVAWVPPERVPAALAAAESATVAQDSALLTEVSPIPVDSALVYLQVSRTQNPEWAALLAKQLKGDGYPASVLAPSEPEEGYRVVVGPYPTREAAESSGRAMGRAYFVLRLPATKP